ncbi:MAG: hypothetical protein GXY82_01570 [Methanospirillum sp.]|nr:hypothetical protein [Methanospirillum sp.]
MDKHTTIAGIVAGGIAVTAGGGVTIVAEGWQQSVLVALAVGAAFGLGTWSADRRVSAVVAVVRSFCEEVATYYVARQDGEITDAEAREIASRVGRLVADLEALALELCRRDPG